MAHTLEFSSEELLATDDIEEPLLAGGVRCHGGFLHDGSYVSPRTRFRRPALAAWPDHHRTDFGTEILHAPVETWPGTYTSVHQAPFLLRHGLRVPILAHLNRPAPVAGVVC